MSQPSSSAPSPGSPASRARHAHTAAGVGPGAAGPRQRPRGSAAVAVISGLGELLITLGVIGLLFLAWQLWWTNIGAEQERDEAADQLFSNLEELEPGGTSGEETGVTLGESSDDSAEEEPGGEDSGDEDSAEEDGSGAGEGSAEETSGAPDGSGSGEADGTGREDGEDQGGSGDGEQSGDGAGGGESSGSTPVPVPENTRRFIEEGQVMAMVYAPRLGADWTAPVRDGVGDAQLDTAGLGHYPSTELPGEAGNFALAGHRQTHGAVLWNQDKFVAGDRIYVQSPDGYYTYQVRSTDIVDPGDSEVLAEVPGFPEEVNTDTSWLTLTTCHPPYTTLQRMITHAELVGYQPLDDGPPAAIADQVDSLAQSGIDPFALGRIDVAGLAATAGAADGVDAGQRRGADQPRGEER